MSELNYKASNIAKAERLHGENFFTTLSRLGDESLSISNLLFVLEAGGLTEDEASEIIDNDGIAEAIKAAVFGLTSAGFLAKNKEVQKVRTQIEKDLLETSQATGEKAKA